MYTTIRYILLTALRDYLFLGLILAMALATTLSLILGSTAMIEKAAMMASFTAASSRIVLMLGLMIFVCFYIRHSFEQKEIDVLLSRPLSRFQIMLAYWLGFSFVAFLLVLSGVAMVSFVPHLNQNGFFVWSVSLLLESWLVVALALFASFTLRSAVISVLATLGFYTLGRMMAFFLMVASSKLQLATQWVTAGIDGIVTGIALIMPRLDLFSQSDWLVYGLLRPEEAVMVLVQTLIYIPLLLAAATIDFMRKEF